MAVDSKQFIEIDHGPGRTILHEGGELLFFSGTGYLGMAQNARFRALLTEETLRYGSVFGSSRNGNLRLSVYDEAERYVAAEVGAEGALTVSSGMLAGQAVVNYLRGQNATDPAIRLLLGPHTHPALWDGPNVQLPTATFADWAAQLSETIAVRRSGSVSGPVAILVNSLDAVRSEAYDFGWLATLPTDRPITLVVDDSHGLGLLHGGRGIWPALATAPPNVEVLVTGSLAKAVGLPGGVILGRNATLSAIRRTAFFGGCSPMPPAYLAAYCRAGDLYAEARARLARNVAQAEKRLNATGLFQQAPGYPVFYTRQHDLAPFLLKNGIFIYSFAYPTPADTPNTRIVISALHEPTDIDHLADAIANC